MKLAVDPENVKCTEVDALADDAIVANIASIIGLDNDKHPTLKVTLEKVYHEFLSGYYDVNNSAPEHLQTAALMDVSNIAYSLIVALNKLSYLGDTDQRLAKKLENHDVEGIWKILRDKGGSTNPNLYVRKNIASLYTAAQSAADALKQALKKETDPKKAEKLERQLFLLEWSSERDPIRHEEYKQRVKSRKTPKDLPLRNSIKQLKVFFDIHVDIPFTAGKYYPETGFKSPAFYAVKTILEKIYPAVSDRKIASIMQEMTSNNGYNFYSDNESKTCSTD